MSLEKIEKTTIPEKATDMELALFLSTHINNPCGDTERNLRDFYIREAKRALLKMQNMEAKGVLEDVIKQF